ncbi:MAG TPA: HAMP domain-containing sensor histidine kinase [Gemmatimonadaceae bacterium]|nr:HAMP domain-containing sensor histidine kinase [Gemmatimonadaceae bacterium]
MTSIRARLTIAYAGALMGTMLIFAFALWTARRGEAYHDLEPYVSAEADLALNIIRQTEGTGQPVTTPQPDSQETLATRPGISPAVSAQLASIPDYLIVLDDSSRVLYASSSVLALDPDDRFALMQQAIVLPPTGGASVATIGSQKLVFAVRTPPAGSAVARVAAAASTDPSSGTALRDLITTMLVTAPLLLIASIAVAYMIAGRVFQPVDRIIDEVRAITDGRSLHRRLPVDSGGDEITRLAITLNEMMERLSTSFNALRRFTADASHELKTPLAVLRADVERAMSPTSPRTERLIALEEALQETTRMADLVDSLLTLARADEGRFDLHRERVELESLARDAFETVAILGEPAGVTVTMPTSEAATVLGDATRLRQLFLNLGINAVKYTPRGGSVEITLKRHGSSASFSVRDTGIGISAADLPHIFERFYRADRVRSRSAERGGFGLGLAIAHWIAEAHGGTISARSRLGRGSTFTVTLPVVDDLGTVEQAGQSEASAVV